PGLAAGAAAARPVGRAQVQLSGEARGALVVLDPGDHHVRAAVALVLGSGATLVAARRCRFRMAMAMGAGWLACGGFFIRRRRRGRQLGFLARALGFGLGLALEFGGLLDAALVLLGQALLLGQVALARLLELAQDLGLLVVHRRLRRGLGVRLAGLDQGDLLAHHHVDRGAVLAAADGKLLLAGAVERDLLRRNRVLGDLSGLAVGATQEAE